MKHILICDKVTHTFLEAISAFTDVNLAYMKKAANSSFSIISHTVFVRLSAQPRISAHFG